MFEIFVAHTTHDQMEFNSVSSTQSYGTDTFDNNAKSLMAILKDYSDLYTETPQSIYKYFELLWLDQKPAVSIEIYNRSPERVLEFKNKLENFFFVFGTHENKGAYESYHLSVSKVKSIAQYVHIIEKDGFADSAGVIGLLLGYKFGEVLDYIKNTNEDSIKE